MALLRATSLVELLRAITNRGQKYAFRSMPWINIYSPWDIISGALNYYDHPKCRVHPPAVKNEPDPDATTLLVAHTEYWGNAKLRDTLAGLILPVV